MSTQTKCPFCAEEIEPATSICPHCGERLDDALGLPRVPERLDSFAFESAGGGGGAPREIFAFSQRNVIIAAGLALILALGGVVLFSGRSTPNTVDRFAPTGDPADRAAQADLRNALVAAKTIYTDGSTYARADASYTGLVTVEPALCYVEAATPSVPEGAVCASGTGSASISVSASHTIWAGARMSATGRCWWIRDEAAVGTTYGQGATCTGTAALTAASTSWDASTPQPHSTASRSSASRQADVSLRMLRA